MCFLWRDFVLLSIWTPNKHIRRIVYKKRETLDKLSKLKLKSSFFSKWTHNTIKLKTNKKRKKSENHIKISVRCHMARFSCRCRLAWRLNGAKCLRFYFINNLCIFHKCFLQFFRLHLSSFCCCCRTVCRLFWLELLFSDGTHDAATANNVVPWRTMHP